MIFPKGFIASGIHCGIKKKKELPDLAIFYSQKPCNAAGIFTKNAFRSAPVIVSEKLLSNIRNTSNVRAIIANSGCANASTGKKGIEDVITISQATARALMLKNATILSASTGVIGQYLPLNKMLTGIKILSQEILSKRNSPLTAAKAIMTTDTFHKIATEIFFLNGKPITIWGCAKGSGMIAPNMATMLSFILTDAKIPAAILKKSLIEAANVSFNCLTVDGDTSTNDTVFILANGMAGNENITGGKPLQIFNSKLKSLAIRLTEMLASDGEGATHLVLINVTGARNSSDAKRAAKCVAESPLVKTAIYGRDANWGRITAALGRSGAYVVPEKTTIELSGIKLFLKGKPVVFSESKALKKLSSKKVEININLGIGKGKARYYTCDFSEGYIKINAAYRT